MKHQQRIGSCAVSVSGWELGRSGPTLLGGSLGIGAVLYWSISSVLISLSYAIEPVGGYTTESVTHGQCQCDVTSTVTFPASVHHRPFDGTNLYCLVTEAHVCVCVCV